VSEQSLVPDPSLTIRDRVVAAWPGQNLCLCNAPGGHDWLTALLRARGSAGSSNRSRRSTAGSGSTGTPLRGL